MTRILLDITPGTKVRLSCGCLVRVVGRTSEYLVSVERLDNFGCQQIMRLETDYGFYTGRCDIQPWIGLQVCIGLIPVDYDPILDAIG